MNPYIAIAASLGAGLWGIEKNLTPPRPTQGDAGEDGELMLPNTLEKAIRAFSESRASKQLFGPEFVDHYAMTRQWEADALRRVVTDFELERYFESI
jgi:glutamine synthetase